MCVCGGGGAVGGLWERGEESKFACLKVDPFSEVDWCAECKQQVIKVVFVVKMAANLPGISSLP